MEYSTHLLPRFTRDKWVRLGVSVVLALLLAVVILLIPIAISNSQTSTLTDGASLDLLVPFKPETVHAFGGITITKQAISTTVDQGQVLTYRLNFVNNSGGDLGSGVEFFITDTVPADTDEPVTVFSSADGNWLASYNSGQRQVRWLWSVSVNGVIPNGYTTAVTYSVVVDQPLPDQQALTNSAGTYVFYRVNPDLSITTLDVGAADITTTVNAPEWEISKVAEPSVTIEPGGSLTYTLTITNRGHLTTTGNYTITDEIPANTDFVSASSPGTFGGGNVTWALSSPVGINQAFTVSYVVAVTQPLTNAVTIVNQTYSITGGNTYSPAFGTPVTVTVSTPVTITVAKSAAPNPVPAGDLLTYTLLVTNDTSSKGPASTVVVTDIVPADTLLVDAGFISPTDGITSTFGSVITWSVTSPDPLPIGEAASMSMTVRVASPLTSGTVITNDAYGINVANDIATVVGQVPVTTTVVSTPVLEIFKAGLPAEVQAGGQLTYTIHYSNTGNANATNVVVSDTFPLSTSYVVDVSEPDVSPGITTTDGIVWNIPSVAGAGGNGVITLTLNVEAPQDPGTVLTNVVSITSSEIITPALSTATNTITSTPQLNISKSANPSPVAVGAVLTYTITFSNSGNANATNAIITDTLDSRVTFDGATGGGIHNNGVVTWTGLSIPADGLDQTLVVSVTVGSTLPDNTILINDVEIVAGDVRATNTITTLVRAPALTITKTISPTGILRAGDNIEYTIIYTNTGPITITFPGVFITDTFPVSITNVVSSSTEATFQTFTPPDTYVWSDDEVPANGGSGTITMTGQVITSPWASTGGQIINDVIVAGNGYSATTTTSNEGRPGLPVTVTLIALPPSTPVNNNILVGATVEDAYGNDVFDGTPITLTTSLAGSTLDGSASPLVLTTSGGTVSATLFSTVAGTTTLTAQAAGVSGTVTGTTVATFTPGAVVRFNLQATTPQTAGIAFPITISAVDAFDNVVNTVNQAITINDTTGTIAPTSVILVNGITTTNFVVTQATSPAFDTITAISGTITGTVDIEILPNTPTTVLVAVNPNTIRVCGTANVTTTITDNFGNPISNRAVSLGAVPALATLAPNSGNTNSAGTITSTLTGTGAGTPNIVAISGALNGSTGITINNPPIATDMTLTVSPNPLATGGNTALVTATVTDCTGPSAGQVITFTISNPTLATLSPANDTTNASGVATTTLTSNSSQLDGSVIITATNGELTRTVTVVLQTPALTITKTANPVSGTEVRPGQTINYILHITNTGTGAANNVVITDVLPAGVAFASCSSSSGSTCTGGSTTTVTTPTLGINESLVANIQVNVTAATSGTLISNNATARSSQTSLITSNIVAHSVTTATVDIYLPIIFKDFAPLADLRITSFTVTGTDPNRIVTIVVENGSTASTGEGFWVDFYLNPTTLPDNPALGSNRRWELMGSTQGIAWSVPALGPGQSVTLTSNGAGGTLAPAPSPLSNWTGTLPSGSNNLYAFVDSFAEEGVSFVEIEETDENNNLASLVIVAATGLELEPSNLPDLNNLPPRWKP